MRNHFLKIVLLISFIVANVMVEAKSEPSKRPPPPITLDGVVPLKVISEILESKLYSVYTSAVVYLNHWIESKPGDEEIQKMFIRANLLGSINMAGHLGRAFELNNKFMKKFPNERTYQLYDAIVYWRAPYEKFGVGGLITLGGNIKNYDIYKVLRLGTDPMTYRKEAEKRFLKIMDKYPDFIEAYRVAHRFYKDNDLFYWPKLDKEQIRQGLEHLYEKWVKADKDGEAYYYRGHFRLHGRQDYNGAIADAEKAVKFIRWKEPAEMVIRKAKMARDQGISVEKQQGFFEEFSKKMSKKGNSEKWKKQNLEFRLKAYEYGSVEDFYNAKVCSEIVQFLIDKSNGESQNFNERLKYATTAIKFSPTCSLYYQVRYFNDKKKDFEDFKIQYLLEPNVLDTRNQLMKRTKEFGKEHWWEVSGGRAEPVFE